MRNTSLLNELRELRKLIVERNKKREEIEMKKIEQRQEILVQIKLKNELLSKLLNKK